MKEVLQELDGERGGRVGVGSEVGGIVDRCEEEHRRRA